MGCKESKTAVSVVEHVDVGVQVREVALPLPRPDEGTFHEEYDLGEKLGQGAFGAVYVARRRSPDAAPQELAVKVIDSRARFGEKTTALNSKVIREINVLKVLPKSANVVAFYGYHVVGDVAYLLLEKCSLGLMRALDNTDVLFEETLKPVFREMLGAIEACHAKGIVHRDVKPDNFLAEPTGKKGCFTVKLCDFGLASILRDPEDVALTGICGSPPFMAPEMLGRSPYGCKADMWSMGVLAYVLLVGLWPYAPRGRSAQEMKFAILSGSPSPNYLSEEGIHSISDVCADWVKTLLCRDATSRPSATSALAHASLAAPWDRSASRRLALSSAKRCGAFELPARASQKGPTGIDRLVAQQKVSHQEAPPHGRQAASARSSTVSTAVGSDH